jgi:hypothetical protein
MVDELRPFGGRCTNFDRQRLEIKTDGGSPRQLPNKPQLSCNPDTENLPPPSATQPVAGSFTPN